MTHKGTRVLETERLILRKVEITDAEFMYKNWCADSEVTRYLIWSPHKNVEESREIAEEWVKSYANDDFYQWAIVLKSNISEPVGTIGAIKTDLDTKSVTIGYCLSRKLWHNGYMTEALRAVLEYFFKEVGVNRAESYHDVRNPHSGAVMRNCGMKYEGTLRQAAKSNAGIGDICMYSLLAEDIGLR